MGTTSSKKIIEIIDKQYKSIRKYYDHLYGEITVIQSKINQQQYALIEKTLVLNKQVSDNIKLQMQHPRPYLLKLQKIFKYNVDFCSNTQQYYFIIEYCPKTLYEQIIIRQQKQHYFSLQQLQKIFYNYTEAIIYLTSQPERKNQKFVVSNSLVTYSFPRNIKALDLKFSNLRELQQSDFYEIDNCDDGERRSIYLSPQVYLLLKRKQRHKAKSQNLIQSSIVFSLGMNFLECSLLADLSDVYQETVDFIKIQDSISDMAKIYGSQICEILLQMTNISPRNRPTLKVVRQYLEELLLQKSSPKKINLTNQKNFQKKPFVSYKLY